MSNIMAGSRQPVPAVGMGATKLMYTDRVAGTITKVTTDKKGEVTGFVWQEDKATRTDNLGMTDSGQQYAYEANPDAPEVAVSLRRNGRWVVVGEGSQNGTAFLVGHRHKFHDFSF
jgi:hypothetical protein